MVRGVRRRAFTEQSKQKFPVDWPVPRSQDSRAMGWNGRLLELGPSKNKSKGSIFIFFQFSEVPREALGG